MMMMMVVLLLFQQNVYSYRKLLLSTQQSCSVFVRSRVRISSRRRSILRFIVYVHVCRYTWFTQRIEQPLQSQIKWHSSKVGYYSLHSGLIIDCLASHGNGNIKNHGMKYVAGVLCVVCFPLPDLTGITSGAPSSAGGHVFRSKIQIKKCSTLLPLLHSNAESRNKPRSMQSDLSSSPEAPQ